MLYLKEYFLINASLRNRMKKKIIFVTKALWIGGIETALVNLLNHLDYEKYEVTCLILQDDRTMAHHLPKACRLIVADREKKISFRNPYRYAGLFHLTEASSNPSFLHQLLMFTVPAIRWIENRLYIRYIRREMAEERYNTAIIYSDVAAETTVRGVKADKYLMFYHHGAMRKVYHDEIGYRKSEKIIAVSRNVEMELRKFRPAYADKMMTIHNLTDPEDIRRKSEAFIPDGYEASKFNIVSCGRICREKGMDLAVEACARLVEMGHDNIHWWIVGGGPEEEILRERIQELKLERYVTMTGMQRNPYPYMKLADLYVQPSRVDGYPMTVLESLILGIPVIATETDGAKEMIREGVYGSLCSCEAQKLVGTIAEMIGSKNRLSYMKENVLRINFAERNRNSLTGLIPFL